MRRQQTEVWSEGTRVRPRIGGRADQGKRSRLRRLALDSLESRTLMATAPMPVVSGQATVSTTNGNNDNNSSPSVAINPVNPLEMVSVYTNRNTSNGTVISAQASFSTDGGRTWSGFSLPSTLLDPTTTNPTVPYAVTQAEGVGFDRSGNFYVGVLEGDGGKSGAVVVDKYSFGSTGPSRVATTTVYQWNQSATGQSLQPGVAQFSMAVDGNLSTFTDPTTGAVQTDPTAGAVYLAETLDSPPQPNVANWNPYTIQLVGSPDGVNWSGKATTFGGNTGSQRYAYPAIAVAQGKAGQGPGGQVSVVWDDFGSGANISPTPLDFIDYASADAVSNGSGGYMMNPLSFATVTSTTVRGAAPGANFPTATPSSPIGIGPGIQVAIDNTLGSFSPYQGRIYVTYVDRSTAVGNPSDNTNIYLISSDNGGKSWGNGTVVNNDFGPTDGHTGAYGGLAGRPQYEPSIAVDPTTGTVVMSWLDVRNDPSRQRYANYIATSIDGGSTFSPQTFADQPNIVTDAATGKTFVAGPYTGNESSGNPSAETTLAFGTHQGLAVADGTIVPVWATTMMDGLVDPRLTIQSALATMPAGPRIVAGTEGPVAGTSFSSFTVTFDRPVSVASFTPGDVTIQYLNALTQATSTIAATGVAPVGSSTSAGGLEATQFTISLPTQTGVGTYSYAIAPNIQDMMRSVSASGATIPGNFMDQNANGISGQATDYFANPTPLDPTSNPFTGPYDTTTLPIIVGGPRVVSTSVAGGTSDPAGSAQPGNNLVLNGTVDAIDVTFNQPMDPTSFTTAQVLTMTGPIGPIAGPFTVAVVPGTNDQTFAVGFPTQQLGGTYTLTLGAGITAQDGAAMDVNQNAGVDLLFNNQSASTPTTPATFTARQPSGQSWAITPTAPLVTTITVPAGDTSLIQDFSLALNISYPTAPDLTATLTTPIIDPVTGKPYTVLLFSGDGNVAGSQANFTDTVFNDNASTLIQNGAPPFFGQFKPLQSLLVDGGLQGQSGAGTYTLTITDNGTGSGTLNAWSITTTPVTTTNTGLGEPVADQTTASFRIFTMAANNPLASNTWTAVGPTHTAGRVSSIAVDPSDPSGNTVYVAGASGGIWKTTDFLTNNPGGPTYTLLTGNAVPNGLNIGSIAVYGRNGDPNQSIIVAATGEGNTSSPGVGFLISYDGGQTWTLDDSLVNYNANGTPIPEAQRSHTFVGTSAFKVLIDPHPETNGNVIIYAALEGSGSGQGQGGVYRSLDSGRTWQLMRAGQATDIVFDPNSATVDAVNNPAGNVRVLYAAFAGDGVYLTPNQGQTWQLMAGGVGDPLIQNIPNSGSAGPVPVSNLGVSPNGANGRIALAKPALTNNATLNAEYETWLYAAVENAAGNQLSLYVTKDNGQNWTQVLVPNASVSNPGGTPIADPSNNTANPNYNVPGAQGSYNLALAVDPNNPQVIYVGGSHDFGSSTLIRVDIARLSDPYSLYASTETAGGQILQNTTSPVSIANPTNLYFGSSPQTFGPDPLTNPYTNLYRNPFDTYGNAAVNVFDTGSFANNGSGAWWTPFDSFLGTDVHSIVPIVDPATGKTRLLVGFDQGIATAVDNGNGTVLPSVGNEQLPTGGRNGNIQITQIYNGAAQPSAAAAQVAGALFYGVAQDTGFPISDPNILTNGNTSGFGSGGDGTDIATDPTGSGTVYQSAWPCCNPLTLVSPSDFFQVNGVGRTFGLIQSTSAVTGVARKGTPDPQWPYGPSYNFAVNPIDNQEMMIGSGAGRLFGTEDQGVIWYVLAEPSTFDGTVIPALAYGAPDPNGPGVKGALDNYLLAGTTGGHIYVTFTGGGGGGSAAPNAWINISAGLDGAPVERIVTDPTRGTHDAYAITTSGVFYNADTAATNSTWVNITGDLFQQQTTPFGNTALTQQQLLQLNGLAADWRYVIPFDPADPSKGTHPMLYVAGVGGVFRSTDNGTTWTSFPDQTLNTPVANGNLPTASVTDLNLVLGNVDPTTGHPNVATGPNLLMASTYGVGSYAIRLAPIVFNDATNKVTSSLDSQGGLVFNGLSEQSAYGSAVTITAEDVTNPAAPIPLGSAPTDGFGNFSVTAAYPTAPSSDPFLYDGKRTIAIYATDASGTKGNVVTFTTTNNLPTPAAPALTNGLVVGTTDVTDATAPTFNVTVPGTNTTAVVELIRIDSRQNTVTVATKTITGSGTIQDPSAPVGTYSYQIDYIVTIDGTATTSPPSPSTTVQVVAVPTIALLPGDISGPKDQTVTNVTQPHVYGVAVPNTTNDPGLVLDLVAVAVPSGSGLASGQVLTTVPDPVGGSYLIQFPKPLADGSYTVLVQARDSAGDVIQSPPLSLTIDTAGPKLVPTIALLPSSIVPTGNPNITVDHQPFVYGQTDPGATVGVYGSFNGSGLVLLAVAQAQDFNNNGHTAGYYQAQLPRSLGDGTLQLYAFAHNAAGNGNPNYGSLTLMITSVAGDYTGVGKAGLSVYSPSTGTYAYAHAGTGITSFLYGFGLPNVDIPVPADYSGTGATEPAIYRPTNGYWAIDGGGGQVTYVPPLTAPGPNVIPVPGDFGAAGQADPAVYVDANNPAAGQVAGTWYIDLNRANSPIPPVVSFGTAGTVPVPADYAGAGVAQLAVFLPTNGVWYIRAVSGMATQTALVTAPQAGDVPVPGYYDGLARADEAIFRPGTEQFFIRDSLTGATRAVQMPNIRQNASQLIIPVPAAYSGDGKTDPGIYNQATGEFEYINSVTGQVYTQFFFMTNRDVPTIAPMQYKLAASVTYGVATPAFRAVGFAAPAAASDRAVKLASDATTTPSAPRVNRAVLASYSSVPASRPPQSAADSAIAVLGKSYKGRFIAD